ncbi:TetR/AcrR family transcriptional regulator [Saccharibacillus deserti]|uniref:TetR/AcrR family transcriptional regulator n=1 Tax=Saccharibacillus deserti TaxID=1634444 RepID=UPI001551DEEF|nr:TetR/AcrR family transcriptional regulator [Saccharibacillus deserti]
MARSKEFEVNEVLDKAMILFWEQGYEKTSMSDLVEHMGIHRRSLYDTFGDKHSLFLQAMDRYIGKVEAVLTGEVKKSEKAIEALRAVFRFMIFEREDSPSGCLIVNSVTELAARDAEIDKRSIRSMAATEELFERIIVWGQQTGEFSSACEPRATAEYLQALSIGIRAMGRTTTGKEKLIRIMDVSTHLLTP